MQVERAWSGMTRDACAPVARLECIRDLIVFARFARFERWGVGSAIELGHGEHPTARMVDRENAQDRHSERRSHARAELRVDPKS